MKKLIFSSIFFIFFSTETDSRLLNFLSYEPKTETIDNSVHSHTTHHTTQNNYNMGFGFENKINAFAQGASQAAKAKLPLIKDFLINNKYKITIGTVVVIYSYLLWQITSLNKKIATGTTWSSWKNNLTMKELYQTCHKKLAEELIRDIKLKYMDAKNFENLSASIFAFSSDINKEIKTLKRYNFIVTWIKRFLIGFAFPIQHILCLEADQKIARLEFMKSLLSEWMIDRKS
ncbi:MAG: hypothetical protein UR26_C0006G0031 [candidate division TM6 bacterium GW2011_GWF2_32_72]|nr:MAG: hypothetical protein UR26_C0006G0031 [candidate division TM6 bacterium GW2011_GWF2_32_72]